MDRSSFSLLLPKLSSKWYEFDIGWLYITIFSALSLKSLAHTSIELNLTPFEVLSAKLKNEDDLKIRGVLGKFGFDKTKSETKIHKLSGRLDQMIETKQISNQIRKIFHFCQIKTINQRRILNL